jgi:hypothetical protein
MGVSVQVDGLKALEADLTAAQKRAQDLRPVFGVIARNLEQKLDRDFAATGIKSRRWGRSFTVEGSRSHVHEVDKTQLEIGSRHPLARIFQRSRELPRFTTGRRRGRGRQRKPAYRGILRRREIVHMSDDEVETFINKPIADYIAGA